MKRIIPVCLTVLLSASLLGSGCGKSVEKATVDAPAPPTDFSATDYKLQTAKVAEQYPSLAKGHRIYGPGNLDAFSDRSDVSSAVRAGLNMELGVAGNVVDIWGPDGSHYNNLGYNELDYIEKRPAAWKWESAE